MIKKNPSMLLCPEKLLLRPMQDALYWAIQDVENHLPWKYCYPTIRK